MTIHTYHKIFLLSLLAFCAKSQTTHYIPGNYSSFTLALQAVNNFDTIDIARGTFPTSGINLVK